MMKCPVGREPKEGMNDQKWNGWERITVMGCQTWRLKIFLLRLERNEDSVRLCLVVPNISSLVTSLNSKREG